MLSGGLIVIIILYNWLGLHSCNILKNLVQIKHIVELNNCDNSTQIVSLYYRVHTNLKMTSDFYVLLLMYGISELNMVKLIPYLTCSHKPVLTLLPDVICGWRPNQRYRGGEG